MSMPKPPSIPIPDLRFEQSFLKSLHNYANPRSATLTDADLAKLNSASDDENDLPEMKPIAPITPGIVALAIIKDQIFMPLLQGFLWSGFLLSLAPLARMIVASGRSTGLWVANFLGIGSRRSYRAF